MCSRPRGYHASLFLLAFLSYKTFILFWIPSLSPATRGSNGGTFFFSPSVSVKAVGKREAGWRCACLIDETSRDQSSAVFPRRAGGTRGCRTSRLPPSRRRRENRVIRGGGGRGRCEFLRPSSEQSFLSEVEALPGNVDGVFRSRFSSCESSFRYKRRKRSGGREEKERMEGDGERL